MDLNTRRSNTGYSTSEQEPSPRRTPPLPAVVNRSMVGVMNENLLARATFVLERQTFEQLSYLSDRMGVSRSELVRQVLTEPVAQMAELMGRVPANPTEEDLRQLALDGLGLIDSLIAEESEPLRRLANG